MTTALGCFALISRAIPSCALLPLVVAVVLLLLITLRISVLASLIVSLPFSSAIVVSSLVMPLTIITFPVIVALSSSLAIFAPVAISLLVFLVSALSITLLASMIFRLALLFIVILLVLGWLIVIDAQRRRIWSHFELGLVAMVSSTLFFALLLYTFALIFPFSVTFFLRYKIRRHVLALEQASIALVQHLFLLISLARNMLVFDVRVRDFTSSDVATLFLFYDRFVSNSGV